MSNQPTKSCVAALVVAFCSNLTVEVLKCLLLCLLGAVAVSAIVVAANEMRRTAVINVVADAVVVITRQNDTHGTNQHANNDD